MDSYKAVKSEHDAESFEFVASARCIVTFFLYSSIAKIQSRCQLLSSLKARFEEQKKTEPKTEPNQDWSCELQKKHGLSLVLNIKHRCNDPRDIRVSRVT